MSSSTSSYKTCPPPKPPNPKPIVFHAPDLQPDIRIIIFGQAFHAHSTILKLYSRYFRKFLHSADKKLAPRSAVWRYEYVAVIDYDQYYGCDWGLEIESNDISHEDKDGAIFDENNALSELPYYRDRRAVSEIKAFQDILKAMYHQEIMLTSLPEFQDVVRLAEFYFALPILSASLISILFNLPLTPSDIIAKRKTSTLLANWLEQDPVSILFCARKLRHTLLFTDTLIHIVGRWSMQRSIYQTTQDPSDNWPQIIKQENRYIHELILRVYHRTSSHISDIAHQLRQTALQDEAIKSEISLTEQSMKSFLTSRGSMDIAWFYVELSKNIGVQTSNSCQPAQKVVDDLAGILKSNLVLVSKPDWEKSPEKMFFLCAEVEDDELPWPREVAMDW